MNYTIKDFNEQVKATRMELDTLKDIAEELASYFQDRKDEAEELMDNLYEVDYE